ncbi:metal ABC transporter solute-binding protein, Zn/Mn family [Corynebacterium heidelbergense]|uniref:ABC transporter substrate-binding protein n=1 Tax=Corynebacterium heidelbergense TaxID=2055947 RepID=A0A364VEK1_9CORY|nr:zinc ABC transporter substrate-binding protein [Corynebacterium heidelbergense]RAV34986.1 ABC transporter substrate-binding protein [Corynebacterium heidelbergense]WCZ35922.1 Manganese ABC transporter substrate-binding lipoprotein precursor [Corynebacterium heidelbergense]
MTLPRKIAAVASATILALGVAACSDNNDNNNGGSGGGSSQSAKDHPKIKVVASTAIWGDIAKEVAKGHDNVEVETILDNTKEDPHEYEPTAQDLAKLQGADFVVANGAGYDSWLTDHADAKSHVITAAGDGHGGGQTGGHDHGAPGAEGHDHGAAGAEGHDHGAAGENPHVWFDMAAVEHLADHFAEHLHEKDSSIPATADSVKEKLGKFSERLKALPERNVITTESIVEDALRVSKLTDITPEGFKKAVAQESEPSAADVAEAVRIVRSGLADALITNQQAQTPAAQQLVDAAKSKGMKLVNVNETPDQGSDYFAYMDKFISELENATK